MELLKKPALRSIEIRKNGRELLRLALDRYKGHRLASFSLWLTSTDGDPLRPVRGGFGIRIELLPALIAALQRIEAEARMIGWLSPAPGIRCGACGIAFEATGADARFCSPDCRAKESRHKTPGKCNEPHASVAGTDVR